MKKIISGGTGEFTDKKSRFIANIYHIEDEDMAVKIIEQLRKKYWDARHNCYAYVLGGKSEIQRFSDDGEPSGTAGKPILEVITGNECGNCLCVVTRYFGGVLLGTGGLVHSYTKAAVDAIEDALPVVIERGVRYELDCTYAMSEKIVYLLNSLGAKITGTEYAYDVKVFFECKLMIEDNILYSITQLSSGKVIPIKLGECDIEGQRLEV